MDMETKPISKLKTEFKNESNIMIICRAYI